MKTVAWNDAPVQDALAALRREQPFVYGLTNYIAASLSANVLLAVGAAPPLALRLTAPCALRPVPARYG
ncbi:hydroxyethylthiazole kinase-like sugar kinase family protein [Paraburkholderia youngii]